MSSKEKRKECVTKLIDIAKAQGVRLPEVREPKSLDDGRDWFLKAWLLVCVLLCTANEVFTAVPHSGITLKNQNRFFLSFC